MGGSWPSSTPARPRSALRGAGVRRAAEVIKGLLRGCCLGGCCLAACGVASKFSGSFVIAGGASPQSSPRTRFHSQETCRASAAISRRRAQVSGLSRSFRHRLSKKNQKAFDRSECHPYRTATDDGAADAARTSGTSKPLRTSPPLSKRKGWASSVFSPVSLAKTWLQQFGKADIGPGRSLRSGSVFPVGRKICTLFDNCIGRKRDVGGGVLAGCLWGFGFMGIRRDTRRSRFKIHRAFGYRALGTT